MISTTEHSRGHLWHSYPVTINQVMAASKVLLPQAYVTLADLSYPVYVRYFYYCQRDIVHCLLSNLLELSVPNDGILKASYAPDKH